MSNLQPVLLMPFLAFIKFQIAMKELLDTPQSHEENGVLKYSVATVLSVSPEIVWQKITNIDQLLKWDSMLLEMTGSIKASGKIKLRSMIKPKQVFELKVTEFEPNKRMVWSSSMGPLFRGIRTYELIPYERSSTLFKMDEKFSGWMLPFMKGMLPDCNLLFGTYIRDLKKEIESMNLKEL